MNLTKKIRENEANRGFDEKNLKMLNNKNPKNSKECTEKIKYMRP